MRYDDDIVVQRPPRAASDERITALEQKWVDVFLGAPLKAKAPELLQRPGKEICRAGGATRFEFADATWVAFRSDPHTAHAIVRDAQRRNAHHLVVAGDDAFRRRVWLYAQLFELETRGYEPTPRDERLLSHLRAYQARHRPEPAPGRDAQPKRSL